MTLEEYTEKFPDGLSRSTQERYLKVSAFGVQYFIDHTDMYVSTVCARCGMYWKCFPENCAHCNHSDFVEVPGIAEAVASMLRMTQ